MQIPKNVIQTGKTDSSHKIYIEDYVNTFLSQYRENQADFCLYGRKEQEGEISYYFIYGAAKEEPGWEIMESRYFALHRRIGEATFDEKEAWLFFEDGYSAPLDGYFIFYEQNEDMQSYLIAMHQNQPGEKVVEVRPRTSGRAVGTEAQYRLRNRPADEGQENRSAEGEGEALPGEPRRIRRRPAVYDLKKEESRASDGTGMREEKAVHAAQRPSEKRGERAHGAGAGFVTPGRKNPGEKTARERAVQDIRDQRRAASPVRIAAAAVLIGLCAFAVTSVNGYQDVEEAGNFFAEAIQELSGEAEGEVSETAQSENGFVVEETQMPPMEVEETQLPSMESEKAEQNDSAVVMQPETETLPVLSSSVESVEQQNPESTENGSAALETEAAAEAEPALTVSEEGESGDAQNENGTEAPVQEAMSQNVSYIVQKGDNLAMICRRQYGNTDRLEEVVELNGISDPNHLIPGQEILLPK